MAAKFLLPVIVLFIMLSSVSYAQTDSSKFFVLMKHKVEIGKYYDVGFQNLTSTKGKLLAVNKESILMLVDNRVEEFDIEDLKFVQDYEADSVIYTSLNGSKNYKALYSLSAGYTQKKNDDNNSSYYYDYYSSYGSNDGKFNGFNVMGDALLKTTDNFGFRFDFNYTHILSNKYSDVGYYYSYDSTSYKSETEYSSLNILTVKSGILFGAMASEEKFNFYIYIGLGFGYMFKGADISYNHITKRNVTTTTAYSSGSRSDFIYGAHGIIRLSYKISKKYAVFAEPSVQIWSNRIDRLIGINGGITFLL